MKLILQPALIFLSCLIVLTKSNYAVPVMSEQVADNLGKATNQTTPNNSTSLISPTVIQATASQNCTKLECVVIFRTRFVTYQFTFGLDKNIALVSTSGKPNPNPTEFVYKNSIVLGETPREITFEAQKNYAELNFKSVFGGSSSSKSMALETGFNCAMDAPMAGERFKHKDKAYFVGVFDTYTCLVELGFNTTGGIFDELNAAKGNPNAIKIESIKLPPSHPGKEGIIENYFKISAIAILPIEGSDNVQTLTFDEGGRMSSYQLFVGNTRAVTLQTFPKDDYAQWGFRSWTLSDLPLNDSYGDIHETAPLMHPWRSENAAETIRESLTATELRKLNEHYDLAFIESITYFKEAVCFSRGLKIKSKPSVRCLSGKPLNELPSELSMRSSDIGINYRTVLAMEIFELDDSIINYHVVYQNVTHQELSNALHEFVGKPRYWFCSVKKSLNGSYTGPHFATNHTNPNCTDIEIHRIPIDIVQIKSDKCNNLVSFYRYMYQINKINEAIHEKGKAVFAPWMTFDANAVMSHKEKLYFFLSGNILNVYDYNPNKCDSIEIQPNYREYFSSELLRIFAKTYVVNNWAKTLRNNLTTSESNFKGHLFEDGPPIYTGYRQKLGDEWFPPLKYEKAIDDSHVIGPKSGASSMWTLVVLILVVLILLIAILYYVFFSGKQESYNVIELKKLTSKSKKNVASSVGAGAAGSSSSGVTSPKSSTKRADAVVHSSKHSGIGRASSKHDMNSPKSSTKLHSSSKIGHSPQTNQSQNVSFASDSKNKKHSKSTTSNKSIRPGKGEKSKPHKSSSSAKTPRSPGVRPSKT